MRVERGLASRFTFAMSWPNWRYTVLRVIVTKAEERGTDPVTMDPITTRSSGGRSKALLKES